MPGAAQSTIRRETAPRWGSTAGRKSPLADAQPMRTATRAVRPQFVGSAAAPRQAVARVQRVAEVRDARLDERARPRRVVEHREVDGAVLGHDPLHVMARRRDAASPPASAVDDRRDAVCRATVAVERRQRKLRPSGASPAPLTNDSWPPVPEYWRPAIASAATWPARSIASAPLMLVSRGRRASTAGPLTSVTGSMRTSRVAVEPVVERAAAEREGRDRDAVVERLAIGDLARLVQLHDAVRDHLGVDAEAACGLRRRGSRRSRSGSRRCRTGGWRRARMRSQTWRAIARSSSTAARRGASRARRRARPARRPRTRGCGCRRARGCRRRAACAGSPRRSRDDPGRARPRGTADSSRRRARRSSASRRRRAASSPRARRAARGSASRSRPLKSRGR